MAMSYSFPFPSWESACLAPSGYDDSERIDRIAAATKKVRSGDAVYARDGIVLPRREYTWPVISALLLAASSRNGRINLLDFGGAFGSVYYQDRPFLR